jgi:hypothetical protein
MNINLGLNWMISIDFLLSFQTIFTHPYPEKSKLKAFKSFRLTLMAVILRLDDQKRDQNTFFAFCIVND